MGGVRKSLPHLRKTDAMMIGAIETGSTSIQDDASRCSMVAQYSNTSAYGREYAMSESSQKLSKGVEAPRNELTG